MPPLIFFSRPVPLYTLSDQNLLSLENFKLTHMIKKKNMLQNISVCINLLLVISLQSHLLHQV